MRQKLIWQQSTLTGGLSPGHANSGPGNSPPAFSAHSSMQLWKSVLRHPGWQPCSCGKVNVAANQTIILDRTEQSVQKRSARQVLCTWSARSPRSYMIRGGPQTQTLSTTRINTHQVQQATARKQQRTSQTATVSVWLCLQSSTCWVHGQPLTWNLDRISKCFFMSVPKTCWMIMGRKSRFVSGLKSCKPNITLHHVEFYSAL